MMAVAAIEYRLTNNNQVDPDQCFCDVNRISWSMVVICSYIIRAVHKIVRSLCIPLDLGDHASITVAPDMA